MEKLVEQKEKVSQELHEITQKIERTQTRIAEKESKTNTIRWKKAEQHRKRIKEILQKYGITVTSIL